ncbi:MAG: DUF1361 domain-containing protein [Flavobacteriales bacterium]|nr:DUF1361 domain-containing protein [Flavobacteriales bacterium]
MKVITNELRLLISFSTLSVALISARIFYTDSITYLFLTWNLFLAAIPYLLALGLSDKRTWPHRFYNVAVIGLWILFFPNAPYIFTDLFHLQFSRSSIIWYDTFLILTLAWTGILFGYMGLARIEQKLRSMMGAFSARLSVYLMLFVSAFGVYIGRYMRFNSWDVLTDPTGLFMEVSSHVLDPFTHPRSWGMTIVFGLFLSLLYASLHSLRGHEIENG